MNKTFVINHIKKSKILTLLSSFFFNFINLRNVRIFGRRNKVNFKYSFLWNTKIFISGFNNNVEFGYFSKFKNCSVYILGNNNIINIGDNCNSLDCEYYIEDINNSIEIGKNSVLLGGHYAATEMNSKIKIGNNCLFSKDIEIRTGDSHSIIDKLSNKRLNYSKSIIIEDNVWINAHVRIFKGVLISKNSIVANSAIVTKKFLVPNVIIGGFPAKILKTNIDWKVERIYGNL
jgi:acetyltransferase-like isoleucine patch superfamily enzyme